jgi:hypothetical protein
MYFDIDCLKGLKGRHWTLSESAAIWEPISQRALQSWVSGQTLRIRPSCGPRRFGLLSQFKFGIAIRLLKAKLPTKAIQTFLDYFADADFIPTVNFAEKMQGRFILTEDPTSPDHLRMFFYPEQDAERFWIAIKVLTESPIRFITIRPDDVLREVQGRIAAWSERREYSAQTASEKAKAALDAIREANLSEGLPANAPRHGELN